MHTFSTAAFRQTLPYLLALIAIFTLSTGKTQTLSHTPEGWKEIHEGPNIRLDIRYAGTNNFTGKQIYGCGRCFLRAEAAEALLEAARQLAARGYGLILFDCYRPRPAQWRLWEIVPDPRYVADPRKGSMHNRGLAVDLTLFDLATGAPVDMGTPYDFFGPEAHTDYTALPEHVLAHRQTLAAAMQAAGFEGIRTEWWHFSLRGHAFPLAEWEWSCPK